MTAADESSGSTRHAPAMESDEEPPGNDLPCFSNLAVRPGVSTALADQAHVTHLSSRRRPNRGIVILYSEAPSNATRLPEGIVADLDTAATATAIAKALQQHTACEIHVLPASLPVEPALAPFPPRDYVVFNLFEGVSGTPGDEARAASALRALGYRFTGSGSGTLALALNKADTKSILGAHGILTPRWCVFDRPDHVSLETLGDLNFPLIVKPVAEDCSLGVDHNAVVTHIHELRSRVAYVVRHYRQKAIAAEFIDGREFNVSLWGDPPEVLPLAEVDFSAFDHPHERIVSFAAKWLEDSFAYINTPVVCPAHVERDLEERIRRTALRVWYIFGCAGYARVDVRVRENEIYILEVNPNPGLSPDAGFARAAREAGYPYPEMVLRILSLTGDDRHVCYSQS
jgi:D-alanine-D-alanine ligase